MSGLADDFRLKAKAQVQATGVLIENLDQQQKGLVAAIVGQVNGALYMALADMLDYQAREATLDVGLARMAANLKKTDAIRKAAASGDWNEYDRLVAGGEPKSAEPIVAAGAG